MRSKFIALTLTGALLATGAAFLSGPEATAESVAMRTLQDGEAKGTWNVDAVHSSIIFRIKHMGVAYNYGRFNDPEGTIVFNPEDLESSSIEVSVKAENVDTANDSRDEHLRSPDFFAARQFPTISFKGTSFEKMDDDTYKVSGELSMHGVTKEITIELDHTGTASTRRGDKIGFATEFTIKRTDFGMDTYVSNGALGDEVTLMVGLEANRASE